MDADLTPEALFAHAAASYDTHPARARLQLGLALMRHALDPETLCGTLSTLATAIRDPRDEVVDEVMTHVKMSDEAAVELGALYGVMHGVLFELDSIARLPEDLRAGARAILAHRTFESIRQRRAAFMASAAAAEVGGLADGLALGGELVAGEALGAELIPAAAE